MAAWLGLVPRQHSTGGKDRLLGISKRGDVYLRQLLIHGARAVLRVAERKEDPLSRWATALKARRHPNIAAVALANKLARIAYAILTTGQPYRPQLAMAAAGLVWSGWLLVIAAFVLGLVFLQLLAGALVAGIDGLPYGVFRPGLPDQGADGLARVERLREAAGDPPDLFGGLRCHGVDAMTERL
mgnify:CR=1 FL=1